MNRKILFCGLTPVRFAITVLSGAISIGLLICRIGFIPQILFVVVFIFLFILGLIFVIWQVVSRKPNANTYVIAWLVALMLSNIGGIVIITSS
ncbi:MAG: hypothetical protein LBG80_04590 [Bacteroidales bacterium]|nr:hypothetical protein [Bacteroidales bacterium]